ncbi:hypothetical protein ACTQ6A_02900 [Lachnospiraceae bacterium LCP25S3_G4]
MRVCPVCYEEQVENSNYCHKCGKALLELETVFGLKERASIVHDIALQIHK